MRGTRRAAEGAFGLWIKDFFRTDEEIDAFARRHRGPDGGIERHHFFAGPALKRNEGDVSDFESQFAQLNPSGKAIESDQVPR